MCVKGSKEGQFQVLLQGSYRTLGPRCKNGLLFYSGTGEIRTPKSWFWDEANPAMLPLLQLVGCVAMPVVARHTENIKRFLNGSETKILQSENADNF